MAFTLKEISQKIAQNPKLVIVEDYEIGVEVTEVDFLTIQAGNSSQTKVQKEFLITLRLLHRKRLGESFTTSTDTDSLNLLVEHAIRSAESSLPCPWFRFPLWRRVANEDIVPATRSLDVGGISVPDGLVLVLSTEQKQKRIQRKTEKLVLEQKIQNTHVEISAAVVVHGSEKVIKEKIKNPDNEAAIIKTVKKLANERKYFTAAPVFSLSSKHKLIFSDSVAAGILEHLSQFFVADNAAAETYWNSKKRILPSHIAIIDDGKKGFATGEHFDFEGVAGQKVLLVGDGKLQSLLHNTTTGAKYNRPGTGSMRAFQIAKGPKVSYSNLYMEKGVKKIEQLIEQTSDGVFIEVALNWDLYEKDGIEFVQFDALGWRVENGEGSHPVFCEQVSFPLIKYLECIDELSDQMEWHGSVASPAVTVQNLLQA